MYKPLNHVWFYNSFVDLQKKNCFHFIKNDYSFCFLGWCLVWKLYLSKFKLVRELFSQQAPEVENTNKTRKTL